MKTIVLIFLFAFNVFNNLHSQVFQDWVNRYNGSGNAIDEASSIAVDNLGNVYVTGGSDESGTNENCVTIKYNTSGEQQWLQTYNGIGNGDDYAQTIKVDGAGNVYVAGFSTGIGTGWDYFTIKYNTVGVQQWVSTYNGAGTGLDEAWSIEVDGSGNVYVTGMSYGGATTGYDYATIKYNSSGIQQWVQRYNGPANGEDAAYSNSLAVDALGNVFVTGHSYGGSSTNFDYATIKYNTAGIQQWVQRYNGPVNGVDYAYSIVLDNSGNIYVTGGSEQGSLNYDYATIKYNSNGVQQWVQRYNGPANYEDIASSIAVDGSGNVYVTGYSWANGLSEDYATIKYNPTGIQQWVQRYNGPDNNSDKANSLAIDDSGNVYVTGESRGSGTLSDYATIKYNPSGVQQWIQRYNGLGNDWDEAKSVAIDNADNVYVTGVSLGNGTDKDFLTIKYMQQSIFVYKPESYVKWIAGETDTIKWSGSSWTSVNVKCTLNVGSSQQSEIIIAQNYPNTTQSKTWDIPVSILSFRSKIVIENYNNPTEKIESAIFRIKPYLLTRFNIIGNDTTYYEFRKDRDQWNFQNARFDVWPTLWFLRFNYSGTDPYTARQYSQNVDDSIFAKTRSSDYPDWISWVNTFTTNACYFNVGEGIYSNLALERWKGFKDSWGGSCFGIATANALAFSHKLQFANRYPDFPTFVSPISVYSDSSVIPVITELYTYQNGNPHKTFTLAHWHSITPVQTLNNLKVLLIADNCEAATLSLFNNNDVGGHNILAYRIDKNSNSTYNVSVYDNSAPTSNVPVVIDTLGAAGNWTYDNRTDWGGEWGLIVMDNSSSYLQNPSFRLKHINQTPFVISDTIIMINNTSKADISIRNSIGQTIGYVGGTLLHEIVSAAPLTYLNGSQMPPYGYSIPIDNYSVMLSNFVSDTVHTYFFNGNKAFSYERRGAQQNQTDLLGYISNSLSISNRDGSPKNNIHLRSITNDTLSEKTIMFRSINLSQNDSMVLKNPNANSPQLVSYGSNKNFDIELSFASENSFGRFGASNINIPANSSEIFLPQWQNLQISQLIVLVDLGNNGTIDDTLRINNQIIGVNNEGNSLPTKYNLTQNYPNPFNPITTISYDIVQKVKTTLTIFNVLGQEITKLVNEVKGPGTYKVEWDATNYPSGVYFYKMQAGDFVDSKKMILLK